MSRQFLTRLISLIRNRNCLTFHQHAAGNKTPKGMNSSPLKTLPAVSSPIEHLSTGSPSKRLISSPPASDSSPKKPLIMATQTIEISNGVLKELSANHLSTVAGTVENKNGDEQRTRLLFKKLSEHAFEPTKGSKLAAGFDLKSAYEYTVPKRGSCLVKTDIQIQLPQGTYGRVAPRSGLALKNKIDVGAGVIDEDYRGNIGVILFNHADEDFKVAPGDRIAQLICEKICYPEIMEVESLENSDRGANGFGSTGVKSV